jgi:hypothetical protein
MFLRNLLHPSVKADVPLRQKCLEISTRLHGLTSPQDSKLQSLLLESDIINVFIKFHSFKYNMEMLTCDVTAQLYSTDDVESIMNRNTRYTVSRPLCN